MGLTGGGGGRRSRLRETGHEPDYRFTLANERTFLAWIRTALALVAGGLGVIELLPPFAVPFAREAVGAALALLGTVVAGTSYRRWEQHERALRTDQPLPLDVLPRVLAVGVAAVSAVAVVLVLAGSTG